MREENDREIEEDRVTKRENERKGKRDSERGDKESRSWTEV